MLTMKCSKIHLRSRKCAQTARSVFTVIVGCDAKELCRLMEQSGSQIEASELADPCSLGSRADYQMVLVMDSHC